VRIERIMMAWNKSAGAKAAGKSKAPKKELSHVSVKKGASGGHVITHHHKDPMEHPDETHVTPDDAAMMQHMQATMGNDAAGPAGAGAQPGAPPAAGGDPAAAAATPQAGAPPAAAGM
jgi:hypothetical protein